VGVWEDLERDRLETNTQTLKEYISCHIYCAHFGVPRYRLLELPAQFLIGSPGTLIQTSHDFVTEAMEIGNTDYMKTVQISVLGPRTKRSGHSQERRCGARSGRRRRVF